MSFRRSASPASRLADRLFLGGCVAAYAVLIGSVLAALRLYGS
ncbi:MAG: hypothetical protein ACHP7N_05175 [Caulobacterales bacterium]